MTVEENVTMAKKRYELVPPDNGWAYMIGISMTINYVRTLLFAIFAFPAPINACELIFLDLLFRLLSPHLCPAWVLFSTISSLS